MDTCADLSMLPAEFKDRLAARVHRFNLESVNGSRISVYSEKTITVDLGLRRPLTWTFVVAEVKDAIDAD